MPAASASGAARVRRRHDHRHRRAVGSSSCEASSTPPHSAVEHGLFDFPQAAHLLAHLNLGVTVGLQHRLGHIAQEMVVAVAMRHARKFRRDPRHEASCLSDNHRPTGLPKDAAHSLALAIKRAPRPPSRRSRFGEPHALLGQFPHDVESLVSLLGLQAVDRQNDLIDRFVLPTQGLGDLADARPASTW